MSHQEFESYVRNITQKFDYSFTSLGFGSLALSLQFSPSMGNLWPWSLMLSWILFMISILAGGWRLMNQPIFYSVNLGKVKLEDFVNRRRNVLSNPHFNLALSRGTIMDNRTFEPLKKSDLEEMLKIEQGRLEEASELLKRLDQKFPKIFQIQLWCYVLGLVFNMMFCLVNYAEKSQFLIPFNLVYNFFSERF